MKYFVLVILSSLFTSCNLENIENKLNKTSIRKQFVYEISDNVYNSKDIIKFEIKENYSLWNDSYTFIDENKSFRNKYKNSDDIFIKNRLIEIARKFYMLKNSLDLSKASIFNIEIFNLDKDEVQIPAVNNAHIEKITLINNKQIFHLKGQEMINDITFEATYLYSINDGFIEVELKNGNEIYKINLVNN